MVTHENVALISRLINKPVTPGTGAKISLTVEDLCKFVEAARNEELKKQEERDRLKTNKIQNDHQRMNDGLYNIFGDAMLQGVRKKRF